MNNAIGLIFNKKKDAEKKRFVGPINSTRNSLMWHILVLCLDVIRGSGSCAQCMEPTGKFVFTCFSINIKKKKRCETLETQTQQFYSVPKQVLKD